MEKWIQSQAGMLKLNDRGEVIDRHPYKYHQIADRFLRVKLNPDGSEAEVRFHGQRCFIFVHPETGDIVAGGGTGFNLHVELNGPTEQKAICADGKEALCIELPAHDLCPHCGNAEDRPIDQILPADFLREVEVDEINEEGNVLGKKKVRRYGYRWNFAEGKLEELSGSDISRPVKRPPVEKEK